MMVDAYEHEIRFTEGKHAFEEQGYHFARLCPATYDEDTQRQPAAGLNGIALLLSAVRESLPCGGKASQIWPKQ